MDTQTWNTSEEDAGERLDKWLAAIAPDLSRSRAQQLINDGQLTINGEICTDSSAKIKPEMEVTLTIPEAEPTHILAQPMDLNIVYEDEDLLVINKPAGLTVHPGAGNPNGTLVNGLLAHCGDSLSGIGGVARPGIVHRIDKETSGLLVVAKHDVAHRFLSEQLESRKLSRRYFAVCWGIPSPTSGTISAPVGRSPNNRQKMAVVERGGKDATTHYRVHEAFQNLASLVECKLETGRTHQIRVHFQHINHPLLGDPLYVKRRNTSLLPAPLKEFLDSFQRQALHAAQLRFIHPRDKKPMRFEAPLPDDMQELLNILRNL